MDWPTGDNTSASHPYGPDGLTPRRSRFWTYTRDSWEPDHRWLPYRGADEYGRLTLVLPIPFGGYLVWAFWTCRCSDCDLMRDQTARFDAEFGDGAA